MSQLGAIKSSQERDYNVFRFLQLFYTLVSQSFSAIS